jgi:hypothetical protein
MSRARRLRVAHSARQFGVGDLRQREPRAAATDPRSARQRTQASGARRIMMRTNARVSDTCMKKINGTSGDLKREYVKIVFFLIFAAGFGLGFLICYELSLHRLLTYH